jgi:hypothetical protein
MFHAIKGHLARLARSISDRRALCFEYAAWHGWQVQHTGRGTYRFRDPRFTHLAAARTAQPASGPTWAQAATAARIRTLGTDAGQGRGTSGRGA